MGIGLDGNGLTDANGVVKYININNEDQSLINGGKGGGDISYTVNQVQANPDDHGLCIEYITQKRPDGIQRGWLGQPCSTSYWAYSNIIVSNDAHIPSCPWLDQDYRDGTSVAAVQIHMQDVTNPTSDYSQDPNTYCHLPAVIFEQNTDKTGQLNSFSDNKRAIVKRKASPPRQSTRPRSATVIKNRSAAMSSHIISSQDASHGALDLFQSDISHRPDLVSFSEDVFCDMATKIAWPLCLTSTTDSCYDWDTQSWITGVTRVAENYFNVKNWQ